MNKLLLLAVLLTTTFARAATKAPAWVKAIADKPASFAYGEASSAVLLDEDTIDIARDGTFAHRIRYVRRILTADGKENATANLYYNTNSHQVKSFQAWLILPTGKVLTYGKKEIVELAALHTSRELYGEGHRQRISAVNDAVAGAVFAYEAVYDERSISSDESWWFSSDVPVERSKLTINLAEGWTVNSRTFNHEPVEPVVAGNSVTWELRQLAAIRREPAAPASTTVQAWLAVDIHAPPGAKSVCRQPLFSWAAISAFFSPKYNDAATPDRDIQVKADALTAGHTDLKSRIEQLCLYAQKTTYISIDLNAAEGGGMIPQPASKVFKCNYGDCKDKATFLRSLLSTQGIESYPVLLYAGSPLRVRTEWPSTGQFNHCILAIKVDDTVTGPALLIHPKFGRLVIFDPTDAYTPFGYLSQFDCGGPGLIIAGPDGEIIQLPAIPATRYDQSLTVKLQADGSIAGSIERHVSGPAAEELRAAFRGRSTTDFNKQIIHAAGRSLPSPTISGLEATDDFARAAFSLKMNFSANGYGKPMHDTLFVFKPAIFPGGHITLRRIKRTLPVTVHPYEFTETSRFTFPPDYVIDELPVPVELTSPYGEYKATILPDENHQLVLRRSLRLAGAVVPAAEYEALRSFYEKITQAEQSPVVLKRKPI